MDIEDKKQISFGKLISEEKFTSSHFIPEKIQDHLKKAPYYLFIYIPADDIIKISVFPCKNATIKKILIRLKEFSPDLVKGISDVLKNFNLGDGTIHTTGLCFESINCFYETYLDTANIKNHEVSLAKIKDEFLKVPRVEEVSIIDIEPDKEMHM